TLAAGPRRQGRAHVDRPEARRRARLLPLLHAHRTARPRPDSRHRHPEGAARVADPPDPRRRRPATPRAPRPPPLPTTPLPPPPAPRVPEPRGPAWPPPDAESGSVRVLGKGRKERVVPVGRPALRALARYRTACTAAGLDAARGPVFRNRAGGRLTSRSVDRLMARYVAASGTPTRATPHA